MTKKLEQLFDLPAIKDEPTATSFTENLQQIKEIDDAIDKIDAALPTVKDLEAADQEMDELADLAKENFDNLMDLEIGRAHV